MSLKITLKLYVILLLTAVSANGNKVEYKSVEPKASFQAITELPFKKPDQKVSYGDDKFQFGWLWKSAKKTNNPLIVFVHGGCWLNAFGVDHSFPFATALSQQGFSVWSLEYRRTGDTGGGWPGSFKDIKLALSNVAKLKQHGVDTTEVILMGHSAGGHLALLAATEVTSIHFAQVIGLAAITDISRYAHGQNSCQQATVRFMNGMPFEQSKAYQQASLVDKVLIANTILLQGKADQIVPMTQSKLQGANQILID